MPQDVHSLYDISKFVEIYSYNYIDTACGVGNWICEDYQDKTTLSSLFLSYFVMRKYILWAFLKFLS